MKEELAIRILGQTRLIELCTEPPESLFPYQEALKIYQELIPDYDKLKTYCRHRKMELEIDFKIGSLDVYEGLFQLGVGPGQERLYGLGVLYYLLECPKKWGCRLGPNGGTYFCFQGPLEKVENVYQEYEKKMAEEKKKLLEKKRLKKEQAKKDLENQPVGFFTKKKKKKKKRRRKKKKMGLIKIDPQQGRFTLFLKHPCYLYLKEIMNKISDEDNQGISNILKEFMEGVDMRGFYKWYEDRISLEEQLRGPNWNEVMRDLHKSNNLEKGFRQVVQSKGRYWDDCKTLSLPDKYRKSRRVWLRVRKQELTTLPIGLQ
jgi:hypothetical protein